MSLQTRLASLITAIGADVKALRTTENSLETIVFHHAGVISAGTGVFEVPIKGGTFDIVSVAARASTAPVGASTFLSFDVNKNGTTIYGTQGNRPIHASTSKDATVGAHSVTSVTTGDYLSVDVDAIGNTTPGSNAVLVIRLQRTA